MNFLRLIFYLTILSIVLTAAGSGFAVEDSEGSATTKAQNCALATKQMLQAIQADPDQLEKIFQQSILKLKQCSCELLTAAIQSSDGGAASVKQLVVIALTHAEEQASDIAECAVLAAPTQLEAIRAAFAEVKPKPKSVVSKTPIGKSKIGAMMKKLVPGWKKKPEPEPRSKPPLSTDAAAVSGTDSQNRTSGKKVMSEDPQSSGDDKGAVGVNRFGFAGPLHHFDFDYLWHGLLSGDESGQSANTSQWFSYVENGFDSNVNTAAGNAAVDSYHIGGGIGTYYARATRETQFDLRARFGVRYDENAPIEMEDVTYRGRLMVDLEHKVSERLKMSDQFGITYDAEPDFLSGETTGFRTDQYVFAYNRLAFGYRWAKHFETRTYYTVSSIQYEDDTLKIEEDRLRHLIGQQFRYLLNKQQVVFLEYRYGRTDFQNVVNDSHSHYFLGGLEYQISTNTKGVIVGGAEKRSFERFSDEWRPYGEVSFQALWSDRTRLRWGARLGFEDAEIGVFQNRYSFRTGLALEQGLSDRLRGSLGFFYLHSDFDTGGQDIRGYTDDAVMLQLALSYALLENLELYLGYEFTNYDSGDPMRKYDRHRVSLGLNSSF